MKNTIQFKKIHHDAQIPVLANPGDAGLDLVSVESIEIQAGARALVRTGLSMALPHGFVGLIWPRSKLAAKYGIDTLAGVVDAGYRGEIHVSLINHGFETFEIRKGDKIAQMIVQETHSDFEIYEVDHLQETQRGSKGITDDELRLR